MSGVDVQMHRRGHVEHSMAEDVADARAMSAVWARAQAIRLIRKADAAAQDVLRHHHRGTDPHLLLEAAQVWATIAAGIREGCQCGP